MCTTACPMTDSGGQLAGFVSNALAVHAFCSVVKREGSCLGSSTLTDLTLASVPIEPGGVGQLHGQAVPSALLVGAAVETMNTGLNGRTAKFATWKQARVPFLTLVVVPVSRVCCL